jgi:response regulator RpfG family c-di-GMP phosphodiesterase
MYEDYSVLFVDDEVNILSSLKRGLIDQEYKCLFASSAKEALGIFESNTISVIVTDMRMPEMDGLSLLREVEKKWPRTVRIVLTGYTQVQQVLATINQVDIYKFITKPWKLEGEFIEVIKKALDYYIILDQNEAYKKALELKNQAYQKILKSMEGITVNAKRNIELLGTCIKSIMIFNANNLHNKQHSVKEIYEYEEKIITLFVKAVQDEETEVLSDNLTTAIINGIEAIVKVTSCDNKVLTPKKLKVYIKMIEAIVVMIAYMYKNEFTKNGVHIKILIENNDVFSFNIVSPNAFPKNLHNDVNFFHEARYNLLNTVLGSIAEPSKINFQLVNESSMQAFVFSMRF